MQCSGIHRSIGVHISKEFVSEKIKDEVLVKDQKDAFKDFIKEKVREAKKAQWEAREARKKAVEEMDEETKAAYENMRFYKFYLVQTPDASDLSQVKVRLHY
ncbi:protein HEAT INTOLERANT 4-like isoform X2 [Magnolia sinica]|uniref:protein HEAT INTOLERANT 4-like isoform X2 n=1 Tax=Magnolia sinica TaxID=86752 RepID=UPI00265A8691|nr:protein HEAT INTOLERANT 4-like isoform X2 [Magnolia sinica]